MKKIIFFLLFMSLGLKMSAQELTSTQVYELLQSYEWSALHFGRPYSFTFSPTVFHFRMYKTESSNYECDDNFYLSDTADTVFVASKMGQAQGSHYIISKEPGNRASWLEIVSISSDHLTLRSSHNAVHELTACPKQGGNTPE